MKNETEFTTAQYQQGLRASILCVAVCHSVFQCIAVCYSSALHVLQDAVCCSLQDDAVCCSCCVPPRISKASVRFVAVCCHVLPWVAGS